MIKLKDVRDKLQDALTADGTLRFVGGAADYKDFLSQLAVSRSAFVMPGTQKAGDNTTGTQVISQRVRFGFSVIVAFVAADATTPDALDDVEPVCDAVRDLLLGWMPAGEVSPILFDGLQVVDFDADAGLLAMQVDFFNETYLRKGATT